MKYLKVKIERKFMTGIYRGTKKLIPRPMRSNLYHWFDMWRTRVIAIYSILRPNSRLLGLLHNGTTFVGDGFATSHFVGFLEDTQFEKAFASSLEGVPNVLGPPHILSGGLTSVPGQLNKRSHWKAISWNAESGLAS